MAKRLLFLTGTRADYGKMEPLAAIAHQAGYHVTFFVTGMHMLERYGLTKFEVHRPGVFNVVEFFNQREGDPQDIVLAKTIVGFSDFLQETRPDLVIIHGDRVEALAGALVCATNGIFCAHVEGGEVSGTIDDMFRHCNTKLSTVHLVSSEEARRRVIRLGERADAVEVIGSPELDAHDMPTGLTLDDVRTRYDIGSADYGICIFHPVVSEREDMGRQAQALFSALEESGRYFVVVLPNNDPGADGIVDVIDKLPAERFRVLPSMRFLYFSELLRQARVMVGNSSAGVREAPFLGVPSLDLGTRQSSRSNAESVTHTSPFDREGIAAFLHTRWGVRLPRCATFGRGNAAENFLALLGRESFWTQPYQKYFVDDATDA